MADLEALRYRHDEIRRALDIQRETVDVLFARANVILVATLAVSAFLGTDTATNAEPIGVVAGLAALGSTVALFGAILWPRRETWSWYTDPEDHANTEYNDPRLTLEPFLIAGITGMAKASKGNVEQIGKIGRLLVYEAIAGGITTAIWLVLSIQ